jgi:hypothetical protein
LKQKILFPLTVCGMAVLLAVGLLFFAGSPDRSVEPDRVGRLAPTAPCDLSGRGGEHPSPVPGPGPEVRPAGPRSISSEAVQARVADLKDTLRPLEEREAEVAAMGCKGDAESVTVLMAMGDQRVYLNWAAVKALGSVSNAALKPAVAEYLGRRLESGDSRIACESARSLARLKGAEAVPELAAALLRNRQRADGHQEIVCSAIVKTLEEICSPAAVPALSAELARSEEQGWSLEYGSKVVLALRQIRTPEGDTAMLAYADRLEARRPADPLARKYFEEKIAEARPVIAPAAANQEKTLELSE